MTQNYGDMYNSLSELHKINSSTITKLLEKNKKLYEDVRLKDEELNKANEKIKNHAKEIDVLNEEIKKLKKNNSK